MLLFTVVVALSLLFSFVCSLCEATLLSVSHARIETLARAGSRAGLLLRRFRHEPDRPIAAILVLNTIANSGGAALATDQFTQAFPGVSPAWFAAAFVVTVLAITEIVPKTIGVLHGNALAVPVAHTVRVMVVALTPALLLTRRLSRMFAGKGHAHATSLEDIRVLTTVGMSQGAFGQITANLIHNATRLRETQARDVMVARDRIAYLSGRDSTEQNLQRLQRSGHSRLPFTPDGELDHVTGFVMAKELLFALRERPDPNWDDLLIPLLVMPETATLNHVLRRFQREKRHLAIVVDEYGSTRGIVTLEDVLEEIVGEIDDEHDADDAVEEMIRANGDGFHVSALTPIAEFNARFGASLPDEDFDTLGGLVTASAGQVPAVGDNVEVDGFRFQVLEADDRRVHLLHLDTPA